VFGNKKKNKNTRDLWQPGVPEKIESAKAGKDKGIRKNL